MSGRVISGYGIRYNAEAVIGDMFREKIAPGAFDRSLRELPDVLMLQAHDMGRVLGRVSAGTLRLRSDRVGLYYSLEVDPTTPSGQEAIGNVGRQDVRQTSFGFVVRSEKWDDGGDQLPLRTILDGDLYELSLVAMPAYEQTSASLLDDPSASEDDIARHNSLAAQRRIRDSRSHAMAAMRRRGIRV